MQLRPCRPIGLADAESGLRLSRLVGWNQNLADWREMLRRGHGLAIEREDGLTIATALALPYGAEFSWVSMVLVDPAWRRRGLAKQLMELVVADVERSGRVAILDATPAGREVYRQIGFVDTWGFARWRLPRAVEKPGPLEDLRGLAEADWPAIADLDRRAFGGDRLDLLRHLAGRLPEAALVSERAGKLTGFALGRDGLNRPQIGPVAAESEGEGIALVRAAHQRLGPADGVYLDLLDREANLAAMLAGSGATQERPFTRMVRGRGHGFGEASLLVAVAGPELG